MAKYYVFETQVRPDGEINSMPVQSRSTLALGLSLYFERCSKMSADTSFKSVHVLLTDEHLNQIEHRDVLTSYVEPEPSPDAPDEAAE